MHRYILFLKNKHALSKSSVVFLELKRIACICVALSIHSENI